MKNIANLRGVTYVRIFGALIALASLLLLIFWLVANYSFQDTVLFTTVGTNLLIFIVFFVMIQHKVTNNRWLSASSWVSRIVYQNMIGMGLVPQEKSLEWVGVDVTNYEHIRHAKAMDRLLGSRDVKFIFTRRDISSCRKNYSPFLNWFFIQKANPDKNFVNKRVSFKEKLQVNLFRLNANEVSFLQQVRKQETQILETSPILAERNSTSKVSLGGYLFLCSRLNNTIQEQVALACFEKGRSAEETWVITCLIKQGMGAEDILNMPSSWLGKLYDRTV